MQTGDPAATTSLGSAWTSDDHAVFEGPQSVTADAFVDELRLWSANVAALHAVDLLTARPRFAARAAMLEPFALCGAEWECSPGRRRRARDGPSGGASSARHASLAALVASRRKLRWHGAHLLWARPRAPARRRLAAEARLPTPRRELQVSSSVAGPGRHGTAAPRCTMTAVSCRRSRDEVGFVELDHALEGPELGFGWRGERDVMAERRVTHKQLFITSDIHRRTEAQAPARGQWAP